MTDIVTWEPSTLYLPGSLVAPRTIAPIVIGTLTNADFESGDSGWTKGTGWVIDSTSAFAGSWSAATTNTTLTDIESTPFAAVIPGQSVDGKCFVDYGSDVEGNAEGYLRLNWYTSGDVLISSSDGAGLLSTGASSETDLFLLPTGDKLLLPDGTSRLFLPTIATYKEITITAIAPATAAKAKIAFRARVTLGTLRIDNFSWDVLASGTPTGAGLVFKAIQSDTGLSGVNEPTWPTVAGNTVIDNEVTWEGLSANTVTWEASSILTSGATEPAWPIIGDAVISDNNISWKTVRLNIEDKNCPQTKEVAISASKIFAGDDDIVRFSATLNPRDWTSFADAGFLPTGLHQEGEVGVSALGVYRGNLAVWSPSTFQIWQVDPDPAAMALLDSMEGVGSTKFKAVMPVANDLFFLAALGVRTVSIAEAAQNLATGDAGLPIDTLVQAENTDLVEPLAMYYPSAGQFWLAFPPTTSSVPGNLNPLEPIAGVCTSIATTSVGQPLGPTAPAICEGTGGDFISETSPDTKSIGLSDSKAVCCTMGFSHISPIHSSGVQRKMFEITRIASESRFFPSLDSNGVVHIEAKNISNVLILDVEISNNGVSMLDSESHLMGCVFNMDDSTKREIWLDGVDVTNDQDYVTWKVYTDDLIHLKGAVTDDMAYYFGGGYDALAASIAGWGSGTGNAFNIGLETLGFLSFSDSCTLVPRAMWDDNKNVLDPQGDYTGWYSTQPPCAFSTSFYKQAGSWALNFEKPVAIAGNSYGQVENSPNQLPATQVNQNQGTDVGGVFNPPSTVPAKSKILLALPHWENLSTGMAANYINLNNYSSIGFSGFFVTDVDTLNDWEQTTPLGGRRISVSTTFAGNTMTLKTIGYSDKRWYRKAALVLTDNNGFIVDWVYRNGKNYNIGGQITIPADGDTYWIIPTSDTGYITWLFEDISP